MGAALVAASPTGAVDWSKAVARDVALFLPGKVSWEKTLTASAHKGAAKIRAGETCMSCHEDEAAEMGASQAEATGFSGRSNLTVQVRAAIEGDALHLQVSGPAQGGAAPLVALMLGNDALKSTAQAGCWAACHDDAPGMASDGGLKLGKYLSRSRAKNSATGGGNSVRPQPELDAALAAGEFLDLIEVHPDGKAERGYVLDKFHERDSGVSASLRTEGDRWIAELSRPLAAGSAGEMALQDGKVYYFGVAVRDAGVDGHQHLVSLAHSLGIAGATAEVVAARQ
jgi:cytochrome c-type protein NapC